MKEVFELGCPVLLAKVGAKAENTSQSGKAFSESNTVAIVLCHVVFISLQEIAGKVPFLEAIMEWISARNGLYGTRHACRDDLLKKLTGVSSLSPSARHSW